MLSKIKKETRRFVQRTGFDVVRHVGPESRFHSDHYLRHNSRRLEHLASLRIPIAGKRVLEVGAGIGDHSQYYIDRACELTITEAREDNLRLLRSRYPEHCVRRLDMDSPIDFDEAPFDVSHCYGLLYHLRDPQRALAFLSKNTDLLLLETCVSFGDQSEPNFVTEAQKDPTQSVSGAGCRPTRAWVFTELQKLFEYVYLPTTQPRHEEFPIDWTNPAQHPVKLQRAVFVASHRPVDNDQLTTSLIMQQTRHA